MSRGSTGFMQPAFPCLGGLDSIDNRRSLDVVGWSGRFLSLPRLTNRHCLGIALSAHVLISPVNYPPHRLPLELGLMGGAARAAGAPRHPPAPRLTQSAFGMLRSMPLDSQDAYVLSRIDGVTLAHEIVDACGLDAIAVTEALNRMTAMGLIEWDEAPPSEGSEVPSGRPEGRISGSRMSSKRNIEAAGAPTPELQQRFERLTHYQLLGLYADCTDDEITRDHARARNLEDGTLAARMAARLGAERVLARIATAYEALRSPEGRRKYDEYLLYREETCAIEDALAEGVRRASLVPPPVQSSSPVSKGDFSKDRSTAPLPLPAEEVTADYLIAALREHARRGARRRRAEGLVRDAFVERATDNLVGATNALRLANSIGTQLQGARRCAGDRHAGDE